MHSVMTSEAARSEWTICFHCLDLLNPFPLNLVEVAWSFWDSESQSHFQEGGSQTAFCFLSTEHCCKWFLCADFCQCILASKTALLFPCTKLLFISLEAKCKLITCLRIARICDEVVVSFIWNGYYSTDFLRVQPKWTRSYLKGVFLLSMVAPVYHPSYLGGWMKQGDWKFKAA